MSERYYLSLLIYYFPTPLIPPPAGDTTANAQRLILLIIVSLLNKSPLGALLFPSRGCVGPRAAAGGGYVSQEHQSQ